MGGPPLVAPVPGDAISPATYFQQLRDGLNDAYAQASLTAAHWSQSFVGGATIYASGIADLRSDVVYLERH
jgi:hypothetical protein